MKKYQIIVWFPKWCGLGFLYPDGASGVSLIYDWFLWIMFIEVRKWAVNPDKKLAKYKALNAEL
jgi:hypothetical protein